MQQVKCDKCDWILKIEFDDIKNWHMKKCPECDDCIIVNDKDMEVLKSIMSSIELGIVSLSVDGEGDTIIDTAELRDSEGN